MPMTIDVIACVCVCVYFMRAVPSCTRTSDLSKYSVCVQCDCWYWPKRKETASGFLFKFNFSGDLFIFLIIANKKFPDDFFRIRENIARIQLFGKKIERTKRLAIFLCTSNWILANASQLIVFVNCQLKPAFCAIYASQIINMEAITGFYKFLARFSGEQYEPNNNILPFLYFLFLFVYICSIYRWCWGSFGVCLFVVGMILVFCWIRYSVVAVMKNY